MSEYELNCQRHSYRYTIVLDRSGLTWLCLRVNYEIVVLKASLRGIIKNTFSSIITGSIIPKPHFSERKSLT
jgi:hypothetical protein